jgi:hypothetical protein
MSERVESGSEEALAVEYERGLVEATVLAALRGHPAEPAFLAERARLYEIADAEAREEAFASIHRLWFVGLALDQPLLVALAEHPGIAARCRRCIVSRTLVAREESADLLVAPPAPPTVLVRVRAERLSAPDRVLAFLRHELLHIADMLDPAFAYEPRPPRAEGPLQERGNTERYRVLWDAFVDGRLTRAGHLEAAARAVRREDFARAFPELGAGTEAAFARFFAATALTHADLVAFAGRRAPTPT